MKPASIKSILSFLFQISTLQHKTCLTLYYKHQNKVIHQSITSTLPSPHSFSSFIKYIFGLVFLVKISINFCFNFNQFSLRFEKK